MNYFIFILGVVIGALIAVFLLSVKKNKKPKFNPQPYVDVNLFPQPLKQYPVTSYSSEVTPEQVGVYQEEQLDLNYEIMDFLNLLYPLKHGTLLDVNRVITPKSNNITNIEITRGDDLEYVRFETIDASWFIATSLIRWTKEDTSPLNCIELIKVVAKSSKVGLLPDTLHFFNDHGGVPRIGKSNVVWKDGIALAYYIIFYSRCQKTPSISSKSNLAELIYCTSKNNEFIFTYGHQGDAYECLSDGFGISSLVLHDIQNGHVYCRNDYDEIDMVDIQKALVLYTGIDEMQIIKNIITSNMSLKKPEKNDEFYDLSFTLFETAQLLYIKHHNLDSGYKVKNIEQNDACYKSFEHSGVSVTTIKYYWEICWDNTFVVTFTFANPGGTDEIIVKDIIDQVFPKSASSVANYNDGMERYRVVVSGNRLPKLEGRKK